MNLLAVRFSAMGDVALTVPAIFSVLEEHHDVHITVLSRPFFAPLFQGHPRLHFMGAEVDGVHQGVSGLWQLSAELKKQSFDAVIDLHDVLRSRVLCAMLRFRGLKILRFEKGRAEKKAQIGSTRLVRLPHVSERYLKTFEGLGLKSTLKKSPWLIPVPDPGVERFLQDINVSQSKKVIGIAPFSLHRSKEWGKPKVKQLIEWLLRDDKNIVLLFGSPKEKELLEDLAANHQGCVVVAGLFDFKNELFLLSRLNVMVSMDSANMHLGCITGIPVVSIWGPTHHFLGFGPLNNEDLIVEIPKEQLPCRPCSIFGKLRTEEDRNCARQSMDLISAVMVLDKIKSALSVDRIDMK